MPYIVQVGYSLNALVDFSPDDPISIIKHLMVGSEGTLGFISNVTYNTVPEVKHKVQGCCRLYVQRPDQAFRHSMSSRHIHMLLKLASLV